MQTAETNFSFSGSIPQYYEACLGPMFFEPYAIEMAGRIQKLQPLNLLELACGTGRLTKHLPAAMLQNALITATDINPAMMEHAKATHAFPTNINWQVADALQLPFKDEQFDCIVEQFGVMFYSDKITACKEAMRVLKPAGVFIFSAWDSLDNNPVPFNANEVVNDFFPSGKPAFFHIPFSYYDTAIMHTDLQAAGFKNIRIEKVHLTGLPTTAEDAAKGSLLGTPLYHFLAKQPPQLVEDIIQKLTLHYRELFGSPFNALLRAFVVTAVK